MNSNKKAQLKQKYTFFVGIDISKLTIDYAVFKHKQFLFHRRMNNSPDDIKNFLVELKGVEGFKMAKSLFCMEQTGFYGNHLLHTFQKVKAHLVVENALRIKNSLGLIRDKNDKIDAMRIALYAQKHTEGLRRWVARRDVIMQLMNYCTLRERLIKTAVIIRTALKEQSGFVKKQVSASLAGSCENSMAAIEADLLMLGVRIDELISADEHLSRLRCIITSVPGIGLQTAIQIIICTNEFQEIHTGRKFACYAGIAPFKRESGQMIGRAKVSHMANKKMKALLHLCAMSALRCDKSLKLYFETKTKIEKKPGMAVMNAIRNKLILRVFACVKQDRLFTEQYFSEISARVLAEK